MKKKNLEKTLTEKKQLLDNNLTEYNSLQQVKIQKENAIIKLKNNRNLLNAEIENRKRQMKIIDAAISLLLVEKAETGKLLELSKISFKNQKGKLLLYQNIQEPTININLIYKQTVLKYAAN